MKTKQLLFILLAVLLPHASFASGTFGQYRYNVTYKYEFTNALTQIASLPAGSTAYVYISGDVNVGTLKSGDGNIMANTLRNIHFIGVNDEEGNKATLRMEMQIPANNTEADGFSLHYENLRLMQAQGVWGNSKHLMNFKDAKKHYIDTLEFINCEITELCRSLYRGDANGVGEDYTGAGMLKVFRMENCVVHNGFRQYDAMPAIYMTQPVGEMTFRNNTFYDLTYLNSLVSFGNISENAGLQAIKVVFENNTLCAFSRASLLNFGAGVSSDSEFHIKNNIVLQPNWIDLMNGRQNDNKDIHEVEGEIWTKNDVEYECRSLTEEELQERIDKGVVFTGIQGGLVQLENNMLYGFKYQNMADAVEAGDIIPIGDNKNQKAEFSSLAMEDVPFAWTDFADAQNDFFQINFANPTYKAGKNGAPLGNTRNYTALSVKVEGSKSAKVTVTSLNNSFLIGDVITLTADCNGSLNTFKGWSNGMTNPTITLTIENNQVITAYFEEIDYVAVWNLEEINTNNVVKKTPVTPNYGEGLTLGYARYINEDHAYRYSAEAYDGAKQAIQTRNNKVSGDIRNCFVIQTPTTQFNLGKEGKADYLIINVNEALTASKLKFFVASDNVPYNKYVVSYTSDGTTWTEAGTFDMEGKTQTGQWYPVEINLPELAQGSQIRVKGDETSGVTLTADMQAMRDADPDMSLEDIGVTTEFLFIAEIIIAPVSGEQSNTDDDNDIGDVNGDAAIDVADIASIIDYMSGSDNINMKYADVNRDGNVDVADIATVIDIMAAPHYEYCTFEEDGMDGIFTDNGLYALLQHTPDSTGYVLTSGSIHDDSYSCILFDSLGFAKSIKTNDERLYQIFYSPNEMWLIDSEGNIIAEIPYAEFGEVEETHNSRKIRKAWAFTRHPVYKALSIGNTIKGYLEDAALAGGLMLLDHISSGYGTRYHELFSKMVSLGFGWNDPFAWIEALEKLEEVFYFGNASITALDAIPWESDPCCFTTPCKVEGLSTNTNAFTNIKSRYEELSDFSFDLKMSAQTSAFPHTERKSLTAYNIPSNGIYDDFVFDFNELQTEYDYEPSLTLNITIKRLSSEIDGAIIYYYDPLRTNKYDIIQRSCTIYGAKNSLVTGSVSSSIEKVENPKTTSADIICSFSEVPEGARCIVEVVQQGADIGLTFNGIPGKKSQTVKATGLVPNTTYVATTYIAYNGRNYPGVGSVSFTTTGPSGYLISVEPASITKTSAIANCQFFGLESGFEGGIIATSSTETHTYPASATEGEQQVSMTGLTPSTQYTCYAYVKGPNFYRKLGEGVSFTTKPASLAGTWSCTVTDADYGNKSFTIILDEKGSGTATSNDGGEFSASWSLNADGQAYVHVGYYSWYDYHSIDYKFNGKVDNLTNPSKIEGSGSWCTGTGVSYSAEHPFTFVMTK